jgi:uncharacterized membrane protein YedE/YeeE
MEWTPVYKVSAIAFLIGIVFGAIGNKTNFCTMGAVSDWVNMGDKNRLRAWFMAIGLAILISQGMQALGWIDLGESIYLTPNVGWVGYLLGGFLFGVGMTLASGCGQRTLVRVGGGNLKSLVVLLFLGITAYMTMRGLLALVRVSINDSTSIRLDIPDQGIDTLVATIAGMPDVSAISWWVAAIMGGGLLVYALASRSYRHSFDNLLAGIVIGLIIPAGWYVTAVIGYDDFDPVRIESYTFIAPAAESLQYLMTYTGSTISFGIAAVFGVILGSFVYAVLAGKFRLEYFVGRDDLLRHMAGGILMGFGGVLAMGCTVGQGITGMSTLALGSLLTLVSIIFGSALTMKVEYYRLDDLSLPRALRHGLADMRLMPAPRGESEPS